MAEYIQKTDTLNQGREKLNEAIRDADKAKLDAGSAVNTSNQARQIAQTAEHKADSVQAQFDQVVIEGDSSVEAAQARIDEKGESHPTLKVRIDEGFTEVYSKLSSITYNVKDFGLKGDGITDDTPAWEAMIQKIPEGSRILFPKSIYLGNFISNKPFDVDFQNSTLVAVDPNKPNFKFEGSLSAPKTVVGNPTFGQTVIQLGDVSGLNNDDVIVIKDEAVRPIDNKSSINQEVLKVKFVDGQNNTVEVYDKVRGVFNTGIVTLSKVNTLKSPSIKNARSNNDDSHIGVNFHFYACENVFVENVYTNNSYGDGLRFEYVYGYQANNTNFQKPRAVGSGQGYGLASNFCREGFSEKIFGEGTRHVIDFSSSYNCKAKIIRENDGKSTPVVLAHNGFGGNIEVEDILCTSDDYAVVALSQGFSEVNKDVQIMRDYKIKNVKHTVPTKQPNTYLISIMIQHDYSDIEIDNIQTMFINKDVEPTLDSHVVRLEGNQAGSASVSNIKANVVGTLVYFGRRSALRNKSHPTYIVNLEAEKCYHLAWIRGLVNSKIDGLFSETVKSGVIRFDQRYAVYVETINLEVTGLDKTLVNNKLLDPLSNPLSTGVLGKFPLINARSYGALPINNGSTVSNDLLLSANAMLRLQTPTGQSVTTLNGTTPFEAPYWRGQPLTVSINESGNFTSNRGDVIIPANSNTVANNEPIILKTGRTYNFVGYVGKWHLIS